MTLARSLFAGLTFAVSLLLSAQAGASTLGIDPAASSCGPGPCTALTVQVTLGPTELDADSFEFEIEIDDAPLIGLSIGSVPGNPIAGLFGTFDLLADGTTLLGQLTSGASNFDGPGTFDLATIPLSAGANSGTATFDFLSAEIRCETCAGGSGVEYAETNTPNSFLAQVTVVPEPGSASLLGLGLAALAARRRPSQSASRRGGVR